MYDDPRVEESDVEEDFPEPPPRVAQPAVPNHGTYEIRYDSFTRQPYHHGAPSSGFYLPPGPPASNSENQGDVDLRQYADLLTEDNTPTNEMEHYQSALQLNELYPRLPGNESNVRQDGNRSPTEAQVREWGDTSPIAQGIRRVLSDGSFAHGHTSETNRHWTVGSPQRVVHSSSGNCAEAASGPAQIRDAVQPQADLQSMLVFPGVSAAISSKIDSLSETVKGLVTAMYDVVGRMNDIESNSRPSSVRTPSVASIPDRLQPRQPQRTVDPVHKQRLREVLANAPRKQVQINTIPQTISITPQTERLASRIEYPPFPGTVRLPENPPPAFATKLHVPPVSPHGAIQRPTATRTIRNEQPVSASIVAPHTGHRYYLPPDACVPYSQSNRQRAPLHAQSVAQSETPRHASDIVFTRPPPVLVQQKIVDDHPRDANLFDILDYGRSEYAKIVPRNAMGAGHLVNNPLSRASEGINSRASAANDASQNSLMEMLLFSTVSQQIKKLSGRDGLERAKDYFREFEGLTRAWDERQRIDLLGMKVIDSARLAFEAYEKGVTQPLFDEAKKAILEALSVEDNRKVGAWTDLKNLLQTENETVTEFGTRVKQTVRDAMGHMQSSSQLEELNKKYFIDGLRDVNIRRTIAAQQERSRYTDLIRDGALIERSCPQEAPNQSKARATAPGSNGNRPSGACQGSAGYPSGYNAPRRSYGNSYANNNGGNQSYNPRPYAPNSQNSGGYAQHKHGYRQYNGNNQRYGGHNNNFQRQPAQNAGQQPNLSGGNAVRQAQNFQFPRSPSWQGAANKGSASQ